MAARIFDIVPLLFITLVCVGIVEGGYQAFEYFLLRLPAKHEVSEINVVKTNSGAQEKTEPAERHDYRIILERNLFGQMPQQSKEELTVDSNYADNLELTSLNIVLMGTISGSESTNRAIILDKGTREQGLYEKGDAIQSAFIKEILRGKVILSFKGKDEMLDMSEAAKMRPRSKPGKPVSGQSLVTPRSPVAVAPVASRNKVSKARRRVVRPSRQMKNALAE